MELQKEQPDWFDELSEEQQADILEGLEQLDQGKTFSNDVAKKRFGLIE